MIEALHRQAHNIVERTMYALNPNIAYPLLHAIGSGFVKGAVAADVVVYFLVGELGESHIGAAREGNLLVYGRQTDAGVDLMSLA